MGTEDRVTDPSKKVAANSVVIPFVTFPGSEIKDLIVHDPTNVPAPPAPAPAARSQNTRAPQQQRGGRTNPPKPPSNNINNNNRRRPQKENQATQQQQQQAQAPKRESRADGTGAGTGAHLLKLREKKAPEGSQSVPESANSEFDFNAGLDMFKKSDVLASLQNEAPVQDVKYKKDDFFDSLTSDAKGAGDARKARMSASEERSLNQDTFGAIALQGNNRRYYQGSGRGGGRGGGRGRGRGGGRGSGRGSYGAPANKA